MKKEYCAVRKLQASPQGSKKLHKAAKEGKLNVVKALIEDRQHNPMEMDEAESTALHHAAQGGHKDIFEYLVQEQDCNPSCSGPCSITPLHLAACNNHLEVVQFLVEKQGMDPMCRTETGRTPLHFACQSGDAMIVTYLIHEIRKFLPICLLLVERTIEGHTPLHIAAHYGHLSLIQLLISRYNCDSSISGQHGRYPIHHAAIEGHLDIVKYLIDIENCESSCIDEFKSTPLHLASSRGHLDIVKYLILNKQCDPYGVDSNKRTPFEVAAQNNQIEVIRFFVEEISFLVDITKAIVAGSVVGHKATQYVSCCLRLFSASSAGHLDRVKKLVELEDCDMYQTLSNGRTIIHYASEGCHLDVLKYYVDEKGYNPVCFDKNFVTPLHLAAEKGSLEIVKYLTLKKSFDPAVEDYRGDTPIHYAACNYNSVEVLEFFITSLSIQPNIPGHLQKTILHYACEYRCIKLIGWLFTNYPLLSLSRDSDGYSPLHKACIHGDTDIVRLLIKEMKSRFIFETDTEKTQIILKTTAAGHLDIIKILKAELGCDPEVAGEEGRLPLHYAAENGHAHIMKYLIDELDCNPNCSDDHGSTPLHLAAKNGHIEIVQYLTVDRDCKFLIDNEKNNPLHVAIINGQQSIVQHFIEINHDISDKKSLELASDNDHYDIVQYLTLIQLHSASETGNLNEVKRLVEDELCDPRHELGNKSGLNCAAKSGCLDILKFFAKKRRRKPTLLEIVLPEQYYIVTMGAKLNLGLVKLFTLDKDNQPIVKYYSRECDVPLHIAALDRRDFNTKDSNGNYLIHLASENGHIDIVKYLVDELLCDINCFDGNKASPLHLAASNGHLAIVEYLTSDKMCDPQVPDIDGNTPLHLATKYNHLDVIKHFVEVLHLVPNTKGELGLSPLELAVNGNLINIAKYFQLVMMQCETRSCSLNTVRRMTELESCDPMRGLMNNRTAVHCAAESGSLSVLKYFIEERGCDPQCKDKNNCTPLHLAARNGHLDTVKYLIFDRMCDPNIKDDEEDTPLHYAARESENVDLILFFLVEVGCDPNLRGHQGKTPLRYAAERRHLNLVQYFFSMKAVDHVDRLSTLDIIHSEKPASYFIQEKLEKHHLHSAAFKGDLRTVICLVEEHGRYELQRLLNGKTALHLAAEGGQLHVIKYFVEERQCSTLLFDKNDATPLHLAAAKGYLDIVKYFTKEKKSDPNIKDVNGDAPLHYALRGEGNIDVIKFLIFEMNCDPNISGHFGKTLLHYTVKFRHFQVVSFLGKEAEVDVMQWDKGGFSSLHRACQYGDIGVVAHLLDEKMIDNIHSDRNVIGFTPLHTAALFGNLEIIQLLISNLNCDPNVPSYKHDIFPLHLAAQGGHLNVVKYLVEVKQCDPCCPDDFQFTPLHVATIYGHVDIVRYLSLETDCDPHCFTTEGYTPLHYAARIGKFDIVKLFVMDLHYPAHIKGICSNMTPFEIAENEGHLEVAKYLKLALPLHIAVLKGDFDETKRLVEEEHHDPLQPHKIDDGKTALHYAADAGHFTLLKYFIERCNCSPDCCDDSSITPLHLASKSGHLNIVKYLILDKNTDPNIKDNEGNTPCHYATSGNKCLSVLKFFAKELQCDLFAYNDSDETPLDYAAEARLNEFFSMIVTKNIIDPWCGGNNFLVSALKKIYKEEAEHNFNHTLPKDPLLLAVFEGKLELAKQVFEKDRHQSVTNLVNGESALHCAAEGGHVHMVKYMIEEQHFSTLCFDENHATPLHLAAGKGHLELVKYFIFELKCDPLMRDMYNNIPLHYASCESGSVEVVMFFVNELNCNPNDQNSLGKTPLHYAAENRHLQLVQCLIASDQVNTLVWDYGSFTPLHRACQHNHVHIVECFIQKMELKDLLLHLNCVLFSPIHTVIFAGHIELLNLFIRILKFDPNKPFDDQDKFPLHYATYYGHEHIVRFLIDAVNCDPVCKNSIGLTPLHIAAREGHLGIIKYLVKEKQCDCFCSTVDGDTPLHYAARFGQCDVIRFLVKKFRCPPYTKGKFGMTPLEEVKVKEVIVPSVLENALFLHFAAYRGDIESVKKLVNESHDPNEGFSCKKCTALHCAAEGGSLSVLKYFIEELYCNPVCFNSDNVTPLHLASKQGHFDIVKYLVLDKKCDPYIEDNEDLTPLHYAASHANTDVINLFLNDMSLDLGDSRCFNIILSSAAEAKHLQLVHYMITNYPIDMLCDDDNMIYEKVAEYPTEGDKTDTYCSSSRQTHVLCQSSHDGDLSKVRELVETDNYHVNEELKSGLHCAAEGGHLHILKFYTEERYFHPLCYDSYKATPLHLAAGKGNLDVVKYLTLHLRCDPMIKDSSGNTPLHYAARDCGNIEVVEFFICELKCDPNSAGYFHKTPLHYATEEEHIHLIEYLLSINGQTNLLCWDEGGFSPLHRACQFGWVDTVKCFISNISFQQFAGDTNVFGFTPFHTASFFDKINVIKLWYDKFQGELNTLLSLDGKSALHYAASRDNIDIVRYLVEEQNCEPNCTDSNKLTPLHLAAKHNNVGIIEYLAIKRRCTDTVWSSCVSDSPLHYAARFGCLSVVKLFIYGLHCSPDIKGSGALTPLDLANKYNHYDVIDYLELILPLHVASYRGDLCEVKYLVEEKYFDPLQKFVIDNERTALHCAADAGHLNILKYFIEEQYCNPLCFDKDNVTPLHVAAKKGQMEIIRYLIFEAKCDPSVEDSNGDTPLHYAVQDGINMDAVTFFINELHCDPSIPDHYGKILLHYAAEQRHLKLISYLITEQLADQLCADNGIEILDMLYTTSSDSETILYCHDSHCDQGLGFYSHQGDLMKIKQMIEVEKHDIVLDSSRTCIHCAAENGQLNVIAYYINEQKYPAFCVDKHGVSPLHLAAGKGHNNVVKFLSFDHKYKSVAKDIYGNTPLHYASRDDGNIDVIIFLIEELKYDPNCQGYFLNTPLHYAVQKANHDVIKYLLQFEKVEPLLWDQGGFSAVHRACQFGSTETVNCLISNMPVDKIRGDMNVIGFTILHTAVFCGHLQIVKLLYDKVGCSLNKPTVGDGRFSMHYAALEGRKDIVEYLVQEQNCNPACCDKYCVTPLHLAAGQGHLDIVIYLTKDKQCDCLCQTKDGDTPLHYAVKYGRIKVTKYFVSDLHLQYSIMKGKDDMTPLEMAENSGHHEIANYLKLDHDLHHAIYSRNYPEIKRLITDSHDPLAVLTEDKRTALHCITDIGNLDLLKYYIEVYQCNPCCCDKSGITLLHIAAEQGYVDIVKYLMLEKECDPTKKDAKGNTPLHYVALNNGSVSVAKCLMSNPNCNSHLPNKDSVFPLHYAAQEDHLDLLKYLIEDKNCNSMCQDKNKATPMLYASCKGHLNVVEYLLFHGVTDPFMEDINGKTPLSAAVTFGHLDIIDVISKDPKAIEYALRVGANNCTTYLSEKQLSLPLPQVILSSTSADQSKSLPQLQLSDMPSLPQPSSSKVTPQFSPQKPLIQLPTPLPPISVRTLSQSQVISDTYNGLSMRDVLNFESPEESYYDDDDDWGTEDSEDQEVYGKTEDAASKHFLPSFLAKMMSINNDDNVFKQLVVGLLYSASCVGKLEEIKYLMELKACGTLFNPEIAVRFAIEGGHFLTIKYFIEVGCLEPMSVFGDNKVTLLHLVAGKGHLETLKYLVLEKMCDPSATDMFGNTLLHYAVRESGDCDLITFLIEDLNCDPNMCNDFNKSPLHYAVEGKKLELVKHFLTFRDIQLLPDNNGDTPVHYACQAGNLDIIILFKSRLFLDTEQRNNNQQAFLHLASLHGHLETVRYLISEIKCDPNVVDEHDWLPLHYAANKGCLHIVKYLIEEQDCNPCYGKFPALHLAAAKGHLNLLKYFVLNRRCDPLCTDINHNTPLHVAAEANQIEVVKFLVGTLHCPPYVKGYCNMTPEDMARIKNCDQVIEYFQSSLHLHIASYNGDLDQVKQLVEKEMNDPDQVSVFDCCSNDMNALHSAAKNGHLSVLKYFIDLRKCNPICFDKNKATPLHLAAGGGYLEVVKYLIMKYDPLIRDAHGDTPLHYAVRDSGNVDIVKYFIAKLMFDPNIKGCHGKTPLHLAIENYRVQVIKYLIKTNQVDQLCKDDDGVIPLQRICQNDDIIKRVKPLYSTETKQKIFIETIVNGCLDALKSMVFILDCNPYVLDESGRGLVHYAAESGHYEILDYLVKKLGCSPFCTDNYGVTPLHIAAYRGYLDVVKALIHDCLCDPIPLTVSNDTPLHYATRTGQFEIIKLYIEHYWCSPHLKGSFDRTPMDLAHSHGHYCIAQYFQLAVLHSECQLGDLEKVKLLTAIEHVDPFKKLDNKKTAIHCAAEGGHLSILKYFLKDVTNNLSNFIEKNPTVVHLAAGKGHLVSVKYLVLDIGYDPVARDSDGNTPLHYAARDSGSVTVASFLITKMKCDPNAQANDMKTPLHYAAENMHLELSRYLVDNQNVYQRYDSKGCLPMHIACQNSDIQLVRYLVGCTREDQILTKHESSPLHIAAQFGHLNIVQFLMDCKLRLNKKASDLSGKTPLHLAAEEGHLEIVKYLIEDKGCDLSSTNISHDTPLKLAASKGHLHIIKYLTLNQHCDPQVYPDNIQTVLNVAAKYGHLEIVKYIIELLQCKLDWFITLPDLTKVEGQNHIVEYLKLVIASKDVGEMAHMKQSIAEKICSQLQAFGKHRTILHYVAEVGHLKLLQYIMQKRNDNSMSFDENSVTPLHLAAGKGHLDIVRYLTLNKHYDPAITDNNGDSPLHYAASDSGSVQIAEFLRLKLNCKMNLTNGNNQTPLHLAAAKGNMEMVKFLLSQKCDVTIKDNHGITPLQLIVCSGENSENLGRDLRLHHALYTRDFLEVKRLIKDGHDPLQVLTETKRTALHYMTEIGNLDLLKFFIEQHHCSPLCCDMRGITPLHIAAQQGYVDIVKYLVLEKNCDPVIRDIKKNTPLHFVARNSGNVSVAKCLMSNPNCDCHLPNENNVFPIHYAAYKGHLDLLKYFVKEKECNPMCLDKNKASPMHYAAWKGHADIIEYLLQRETTDPFIIRDTKGRTILFLAVISNHLDVIDVICKNPNAIEYALQVGANIISAKQSQLSPLCLPQSQTRSIPIKQSQSQPTLLLQPSEDSLPQVSLPDLSSFPPPPKSPPQSGLPRLPWLPSQPLLADILKGSLEQSLQIQLTSKQSQPALQLPLLSQVLPESKPPGMPRNSTSQLQESSEKIHEETSQDNIITEVIYDVPFDEYIYSRHYLQSFLTKVISISNDNDIVKHVVVGLLYSASCVGKLEEIKYLMELKTCGTLFNPEIAVQFAIEGGHLLTLKYFIEVGCLEPMSVFGENKVTLLHLVAGKGHLEALKYLVLEKMCDPSATDMFGNTLLHYAVRESGNCDLITFLIEDLNCDPNMCNDFNKSPLHYAVEGEKLELVKHFLTFRDIQLLPDNNGDTPMHHACQAGNLDILILFKSRLFLDTEQRNNNQQALLHLASLHGHLKTVEYLISEIKCDPNVIDEEDWLALHYAANEGYLHIVKYLTEEQDCNPCYGKFPALHLAAAKGHLDVLKYFVLDRLCDPLCTDLNHNTPLHVAAGANQIEVVKLLVGTLHCPPYIKGHCNMTPQQIARSKKYDQITEYFQSPLHLHIASYKGDLNQIKQLVEEECNDPNHVSAFDCCNNEMNALHCAAINGHLNVLKYFIDVRKCKSVCFDKSKATPLHLAAGRGHLEVIKYLAIKGNPFARDAYGDTPLHYAIRDSGSIDVVNYFIAKLMFNPNIKGSFGKTPLHLAIENNRVQVIEYLINTSLVDQLCKDDSGVIPLQKIYSKDIKPLYSRETKQMIMTRAVVDGCLDALMSLISILDCDPYVLDHSGRGLVHYAAENGHCTILNYLVKELGCSPYCTDNYGVTPLHIAAYCGLLNIVKALILDWLCDPLPLTVSNDTPLHYATRTGHFDIIKLYIEHFWCSPQLKGSFDRTPMDLAHSHGHYDIVQYFQLAFLHLVSRQGDLEKIKQLTAIKCVNPFQTVDNEKTAIHFAAEGGHLSILKYFLEDVTNNLSNFIEKNPTVVHLAAGKGHLDSVKYLVFDIGYDPVATDNDGNTPLHYTARDSGSVAVASFLITEMKCDPNAQANDLKTPLHYAAENMHLELSRYLVYRQKVCQLHDSKGYLPIHNACQNSDIQLLRCLVGCTEKDQISPKVSSPLHVAAYFGHLNIVQYLMNCKLKLDPKDADQSGTTPLHLAAEEGHLKIVKCFIEEKSCDPSITNISHDTPLNLAASKGHLHIVKYLTLNQHCDCSNTTHPVLHVAAEHGQLQIVKFLIESLRCQPDSLDSYNWSPLDFAKLGNHFHIIQYLELTSASRDGDEMAHPKHPSGEEIYRQLQNNHRTILHFAAEIGHLRLLRYILQNNKNRSMVLHFDENNVTPLHLAAGKGYVDIVRYLIINKHCDPAIKDNNGNSPLHYAAFDSGSVKIANFLQTILNCKLTFANRHNQTPLHLAASKGNTDMVKFLLSQKCDINVKDNHGITPLQIIVCNNEKIDFCVALFPRILHQAAKHDSLETVRCLIEQHKLDIMDKDDEGYVPLHRACEGGNVEVVEYLLDHVQHTDPSNFKYLCDNEHILLEIAAQNGHHEIVNILSTILHHKNNA